MTRSPSEAISGAVTGRPSGVGSGVLTRRELSCFLKMFWESVARITRGRLFQRRGAALEKALSP